MVTVLYEGEKKGLELKSRTWELSKLKVFSPLVICNKMNNNKKKTKYIVCERPEKKGCARIYRLLLKRHSLTKYALVQPFRVFSLVLLLINIDKMK